ncbi:MAG TPA: PSD1 and planctomycete cytochrome C domain-containing protein [Verrucomicrobiae bacterium]|nr:PSD1 and planctomycete cytochrome C domain-containing protein [Verrucomicrobiae bacterium]
MSFFFQTCFASSGARTLTRIALAVATGWFAGNAFAAEPASSAGKTVDFAAEIQPIFAKSCYPCHGPEKQKGDLRLDIKSSAMQGGGSGKAIIPGHGADSLLIQLVSGAKGEDLWMPKRGDRLTREQIERLRMWIDQGASWPDTIEAKSAPTHWAYKPVVSPPVPTVKAVSGGDHNPIDAFVQARLAEKKLGPSPEADRRTLIRRLYLDLTGLPPTPQAVTRLAADRSRDAYDKLVEDLLASPRYGERWARHWLDVARYAETHGFEMNQPRPNAWPYRDYVIRAFNENKPYDQFVREQIAGDVLGVDEGTGFLVAGAWDQVKSPDIVLTSNQRADELHDIVSTTSSTFLGLTVGCARCHNHKFDPIPQTDYYAVKAVFEGVQHGERARREDKAAREAEVAKLRPGLEKVDTEINLLESQAALHEPLAQTGMIDANRLRVAVHPRLNSERLEPVTARRLRFTVTATTGSEPCIDELEVFSPEGKNVALASLGVKATASGTYPNSDIHRLEHINDGRYGNGRSWISNESGKGWVELEFPGEVTIARIAWGRDREENYKDRLATGYRIEIARGADDWRLVASSADRQPYEAGMAWKPGYDLTALSPDDRARFEKLAARRKELSARIRELSAPPMIYAGEFVKPEPTYRFQRGDPMQKREVIQPGALSVVPVKYDAVAAKKSGRVAGEMSEDQARRLAFAQWVTDPANPLTARVIVNRVWQYHFGEGLVSTPSDFGVNGARPTHPELLDWLAADFMAHGWSLKHLHRLIVTSATYRQSSAINPPEKGGAGKANTAQAIDAGDRLLWRYPSHRLDAEVLRDSILAVSGKLDLRMGGPGWSPFEKNENYVRVYVPKQEFGGDDFRRMVYAAIVRQRPDGVFGAFDCPDGGQIAPKRTRSTTPLQALNLLNSGFILQQAGFLAARIEREAGKETKAQARRAFALSFDREPDRVELAAAVRLIQEQGSPVFCRALLNANEFAYVF